MADYKIAPDSTGIISLGAMRKSLVAEADYAASSKHTTASTSVNTLVGTPSSYQTNCDSFTWSATSPKGFQEMYGETWSDGSGGGTQVNTMSAIKTSVFGQSSFTGVTFYVSETDPGDNFSKNTGEYTAPAAGTYKLFGQLRLQYSTGMQSRDTGVRIMLNGSTVLASSLFTVPANDTDSVAVTAVRNSYTLAANDVITVEALNNLQAAEGGTSCDVDFDILVAPLT